MFALAQGRGVEDQGRSEPHAHERSVRGVRVAGHPTLRNQMDLLGAEDEDHRLAEALQGGEEPPTQLVQPALGQDALEPHPRRPAARSPHCSWANATFSSPARGGYDRPPISSSTCDRAATASQQSVFPPKLTDRDRSGTVNSSGCYKGVYLHDCDFLFPPVVAEELHGLVEPVRRPRGLEPPDLLALRCRQGVRERKGHVVGRGHEVLVPSQEALSLLGKELQLRAETLRGGVLVRVVALVVIEELRPNFAERI